MPTVTVRITNEQAAWVTAQTTQYRKKADVIRDLIDSARQGLTGELDYPRTVSVREPINTVAVSAVQALTPDQPSLPTEVVPAVKAVRSRRENFEPLLSDPKLEKFKDDILAFWKAKKGAKNERAWSILQTELGKIQSKYGDAVMLDQLQLGTQAGTWNSISLNRYEQFKPKGYSAAQEQPSNHPASRVFTAADFDMPNPDNPLKELF